MFRTLFLTNLFVLALQAGVLHDAAFEGNLDAMKRHLASGHPVDEPNGAGLSALHVAIKLSDTKMATYLLECGADINHQDHNGNTPLILAVKKFSPQGQGRSPSDQQRRGERIRFRGGERIFPDRPADQTLYVGGTMEVKVNGEMRQIAQNTTLLELIRSLGLETKVMAAAVNMQIVKQDVWETAVLHEGDAVELLDFVGGG